VDWTELALPIILAVIAAVPGFVALFKGRGKEKADITTAITDAAQDMLDEYRKKIDEYRAELETLEKKVADQACEIKRLRDEQAEFLEGVSALCAQIRGLGHTPVWEPKRRKKQ